MSFENRYSALDRLLHRFAFSIGGIQVALADMEDELYKRPLAQTPIDKPVFITALPRAGTTILLNLLVQTESFASHTYRDMPFVMCPMMWQRFSKPFQINAESQERAHGDGLTVSLDSAEAFEEIIWRQFWRKHYHDRFIDPWQSCADPEFVAFFLNHIRKIVLLRTAEGRPRPRYLSKNNLNVARLSCLSELVPGATILVPFREPLQHASSLLKQHLNFLQTHQRDAFSRKYMADIGHYDFGENLRPVNFNGWLQRYPQLEATSLEFWLVYWIETYRATLSQANARLHLVPYDALAAGSADTLTWLATVLDLAPSRLTDQSPTLHPPREHPVDSSVLDHKTVDAARTLYMELQKASPCPNA